MSLVRSCGASFFQSTLLFPHLLSWVVTSYLVYALLGATNGFVNNTILAGMGKRNRLVFCQNVLASNSDYCLHMEKCRIYGNCLYGWNCRD